MKIEKLKGRGAPVAVDRAKRVEIDRHAAVPRHLLTHIEMFAYVAREP
jgi:hypothetical protein